MTKLYAGLDVSDKTTAICVMDERGDIVLETSTQTNPRAIAWVLRPYRRKLKRVGQESGTKAIWLHKELSRLAMPILTLDAFHAKRALSARPNKTDRTDARGIAALLASGFFTTAYVKSDEALRVRMLLLTRKALQRKGIDLQTMLRMVTKTFGAEVDVRRRKVVAVRRGRRRHDPLLAQLYFSTLAASEMLLSEVKTYDKLVLEFANDDPVCARLMTIPGVGPHAALTFRAAVDDPSRFKSSRSVAAYFGLTPKTFQSGQTEITGGLSLRGDPTVRRALFQSACVLLTVSRSKCSLRAWGLSLKRRKGLRVAAIAVARKLAVIMHRMWVSQQDFSAAA